MAPRLDHDYLFKCIVIGDSSVGKTALLRRFTENSFSETEATVGIDFKTKMMKIDRKNILLMIFDTAGQESFRSFTRSYYRGLAVGMLIYDMTKEESFRNIESWLRDVLNNCDNPNLGLILVANKSDLDEERKISSEEGKAFAEKHNLIYFETSAKSNSNVSDVFVTAAERFYQKYKDGLVDITTDSQGITLGPRQLPKAGGCGC